MRAAAALAFFFAAARAEAAPPSALWEDVAHPNAPRCALLYAEARVKVDASMREAALTLLHEAVARCPDRYDVHALYGELLVDDGALADARVALERARALQPPDERDPQLAFQLGFVRAVFGDVAGSLVEYRRADAIGGLRANQRWLLQFNLADDLMALGRLDEAIDRYRRATRLEPNEPMPRLALAVALDRDQQSDQARAELQTALKLDPLLRRVYSGRYLFVPPADAHYYVALAQIARGRPALARSELRAFLAALPGGPYAPRARDHLGALGFLDPRELIASPGVDTHVVADSLSPLVGELERCLDPAPAPNQSSTVVPPAPTARIRVTRSAGVLRVDADGSSSECLTALVGRARLPPHPADLFITLVLAPP